MFNRAAQAPIWIDLTNLRGGSQGYIGEQYEIVSVVKTMGNQSPEFLRGIEQTNVEPTKAGANAPGFTRMGEHDLLLKLKRDRCH